ncbi:folylpolyglutamate synthase Fol3 [Schizosaccharomyces pombe]|uniref:Probable dihydrofolate synthetase n=1 Tax=Schizosaccharomyces pombe (strain 972 / ATCC 24843) TaxID=284812 RepID=FOLD_SCHPO|nr:putative folylpolyglutamate synthase [Schizosaccharomyces pombe]Q9UTD0.1 RecName: Full=Probable dihydrofolate synthetase; Short=DHFS [Schizosaccharomyces pombe 972h-]CAB61458.1 folylpolyglutamate synthase (predicted) [Schizosaccharomyces pombe]|eukprot:NP_001342926.1 putative folylpolyglutamate synthase [Schizosaccharomyces pombe]
MPIQLGLQRMLQLLKHLGNPQESFCAVQIAGTNGKGSICSYIYTSLLQAAIKTGRYTSPHFLEPRDTISINGQIASEEIFNTCWKQVIEVDRRFRTKATEFELLTATAFQCFHHSGVRVAVIETGMGGRLDATNVFEEPVLSIISRICLDHQAFLGNTLEAIAKEKAGIFKKNVPCVVDGLNEVNVLNQLKLSAEETRAHPFYLAKGKSGENKNEWIINTPNWGTNTFSTPLKGDYQGQNLACAVTALDILSSSFSIMLPHVQNGVKNTSWPGRLDIRSVPSLGDILFDGAHNKEAAIELAKFVNSQRREHNKSVSWVVAFTNTKDVTGIMKILLRKGDTVIATNFSSVSGMPWIKSMEPEVIKNSISSESSVECYTADNLTISEILRLAKEKNSSVIVCGSLYLLGDMYRYLKLDV